MKNWNTIQTKLTKAVDEKITNLVRIQVLMSIVNLKGDLSVNIDRIVQFLKQYDLSTASSTLRKN